MNRDADHFELPGLRAVARHSIPRLVECTLVPLGLFYACLWTVGVWSGILAALLWCYTGLIRRLVMRRRVPGLMYLATLGATARTVLAMARHSVFVYFLQPSLITAAVGAAFLVSVPVGRPLVGRLAHDFVPMPASFTGRPNIRPIIVRITVVWAVVNLIQAGGAIVLLMTQPVGTFVAAKTALCWTMTGLGALITLIYFKQMVAAAAAQSDGQAVATLPALPALPAALPAAL
jgi:hypothetical protein